MDKLKQMRSLMQAAGIDAFVQPVHDETMGEYPPPSGRRLEWLTGFSGSAGTVAVTKDKAALFTDGRYTLQAAKETDVKQFERHNSGSLTPEAWLAEQLGEDARVGYDPKITARDTLRRMEAVLSPQGIALAPVENLIDKAWKNRPAAPATAVFAHEVRFAGEDAAAKRTRIAEALVKAGADVAVLAAPESVCWLLNIRARDTEHTPLAICTALIDSEGKMRLYIDSQRCDKAVRTHLGADVQGIAPEALETDLQALGKSGSHVLIDPAITPVWFSQVLEESGAVVMAGQDPCALPRACKNAVQLKGMGEAHIRDGAAVARLLCWLDAETKNHSVTEMDVAAKLLECRAKHKLFIEPSFSTIAGSGPNGAIVHYRVSEESNRALGKNELFLLDSGGQYPDGTTDITRTVAIGMPTVEMKDRFTRVLKGHIALATAVFPVGTRGSQLDVLARQFLWQAGLDYDHGTGHGVGQFLGVHEGPQRISKRGGDAVLQTGMILSNEPGYYKVGEYGIRIENLVVVVEKGEGMLAFETITCAPIDTRLVDVALLREAEKQWLNQYHAWVLEELLPQLEKAEQQWLAKACAPI